MRRWVLAFLLLITFSSSLLALQNVNIAVFIFRTKAETLKEWSPTAHYLTQNIPGYSFHIIPMDYHQLRQAALNGTVDFIVTNSGDYIYLEKLYDIARIATITKYDNGQWLDHFGGVIFTRWDAPVIKSMSDLKSKSIVAVDQSSFGGYVVQMYEFFLFGLTREDFTFSYTGMPHDNAVKAVLDGKADIGFVRTGVLEKMVRKGELDLKKIRILNSKKVEGFPYLLSTKLAPEWPISRMPKTDSLLTDKVVVALLSRPISSSPSQGDVRWTAPMEYRGVHTMYEAIRLPPYDTAQRFNIIDVYNHYKLFIISIAVLSIALILTTLRQFKLRYALQALLKEKIETNAQTRLAAMVYENNSDAVLISDTAHPGQIISVNPAFEKLTGYTKEQAHGRDAISLDSEHHDKEFYEVMWHSINTTGSWEGQIVDRHQDGHLFSKWMTIRTIYSEEMAPYRRVAIFSDFTDHKEAQQKIWYQANFDPLTSLPNRNMFMYRLEKELHELERNEDSLTLMFLDLDNFKEVNDTHGHDHGDMLLKEAAVRITKCAQENDLIARLGGDEFTILLPKTGDNSVIDKIASALLQELLLPFDVDGERSFLSVSIGITVAPHDGVTAEILMKNADQAMYFAKNKGRNQYHYFTPSMRETLDYRRTIIDAMRDACKENEFILYYQPILDLKTNTIHKAEALIRWRRSDGSMVSPADFIPLAEESGMIVEIGSWVIDEAFKQLERWRTTFDASFQISINTSPVQYRADTGEFLTKFKIFQENPLHLDAIVVEITEGLLMEQTDAIERILKEFTKLNIRLSIDDFGTGYSSLAYLKKFHVDFLKIDQTFVRNLETDENNRILCSAITTMAHQLGIKVIAEGVETPFQRNYLESVNCDYIQGYLISRPIPPHEFEQKFFASQS